MSDYMEVFDEDDDFVVREGDDLGWLGYFIGGNETLTTLFLSYLPGSRACVEKFFIGAQRNKSIKHVYFYHGDVLNEGFSVMNLPHVTTIRFRGDGERVNMHHFALGLRRCKSLKEYTGPVTTEIIAVLSKLPVLEHTCVHAIGEAISRDECVALRELLANATKLKVLDLSHVGLGDDGLAILAEGLANNSPLTNGELVLSNNDIGDRGVQALASSLASNGKLRELHLFNSYFWGDLNNIGDEGVEYLAESLAQNRALRVLSLSGNTVRAISRILQSRTSGLEDLRLYRFSLDDDGGRILADALSINKSLVSLSLRCEATGINIGDDGLGALAAGLSSNSTLRKLYLSGNTAITAAGLRSLNQYFQSPLCALETLSFYSINFGDEGVYALVDALDHNESLKELLFDDRVVSSRGWNAFLKVLCDTSSPNSIYLSNHTLCQLCVRIHDGRFVPADISLLLKLNKDSRTRIMAAKSKILCVFPDLDMVPLFKWNLKMLPLIKSWFDTIISSDDEYAASIRNRKLSAIYKFIRGMSVLVVDDFNSTASENPL